MIRDDNATMAISLEGVYQELIRDDNATMSISLKMKNLSNASFAINLILLLNFDHLIGFVA